MFKDSVFSKADLETTKFGQIYYPPHVQYVDDYQGTIIPETDDGDGGYLLNLHRDFTGRRRRAEEEYKQKRKKGTTNVWR